MVRAWLSPQNLGMAKGKRWRQTTIRQWREFREMTQAELADRIGRSEALISQLEAGKAPYNQFTLEAIANALGCSSGDLLHRAPGGSEPVSEALAGLSGDQKAEALAIIQIIKRR